MNRANTEHFSPDHVLHLLQKVVKAESTDAALNEKIEMPHGKEDLVPILDNVLD